MCFSLASKQSSIQNNFTAQKVTGHSPPCNIVLCIGLKAQRKQHPFMRLNVVLPLMRYTSNYMVR